MYIHSAVCVCVGGIGRHGGVASSVWLKYVAGETLHCTQRQHRERAVNKVGRGALVSVGVVCVQASVELGPEDVCLY